MPLHHEKPEEMINASEILAFTFTSFWELMYGNRMCPMGRVVRIINTKPLKWEVLSSRSHPIKTPGK